MSIDFSDKRVLVTGGTSGLGLSIAGQFVKNGARVVVCGRDKVRGRKAARITGADFVPTDLCSSADVSALFDDIHRLFGQLDIAVNNAGIATLKPLLEQTEQAWQQELDINLTAVWRCMRHEVSMMLGQIYGGVIINMSSIAGLSAVCPDISSYVAAKHGVIGLTRATALEFAAHNIRINALCPGKITSEQQLDEQYPMGRTGKHQDVVQAVMFLASDQSSYITGHALPVDGGFTTC